MWFEMRMRAPAVVAGGIVLCALPVWGGVLVHDSFLLSSGAGYPAPLVGSETVSAGFAAPWMSAGGEVPGLQLFGPRETATVPGLFGANAQAVARGATGVVSRRVNLVDPSLSGFIADDGGALAVPLATLWIAFTLEFTPNSFASVNVGFSDSTGPTSQFSSFGVRAFNQGWSMLTTGQRVHSGDARYEPRSGANLYALRLQYGVDSTLVSMYVNPPAPTQLAQPSPDVLAEIARGDIGAPRGLARWDTVSFEASPFGEDRVGFGDLRVGTSFADVAPTSWTFPTTWVGDAAGNWYDAARWTGPVPRGPDSLAVLGQATSPRTIQMDVDTPLTELRLDSDVPYTITGAGRLLPTERSPFPLATPEIQTRTIGVLRGSHTLDVVVAGGAPTDIRVPAGSFLSVRRIEGGAVGVSGSGTLRTEMGLTPSSLVVSPGASVEARSVGGPALVLRDRHPFVQSLVDDGATLAIAAAGSPGDVGLAAYVGQLSVRGRVRVETASGPGAIVVPDGYSLSFDSAEGVLDLGRDMLVLADVRAAQPTRDALTRGYAGGTWDGAGIGTSAGGAGGATGEEALALVFRADEPLFELLALNLAPKLSANALGGLTPDAAAVIYTYYGDANVDGVVDGQDRARLTAGLASPALSGWSNGDFNYDGLINTADIALFERGLAGQGQPLGLAALIPEPGLMVPMAVVGLVVSRRRRVG